PSSPKRLAQPVSDFRRPPPHIVLRGEAYTTDGLVAYFNRKICFRFLVHNHVEPVARVASCVRIRETIAQVDRNFPVVCITHNRVAIAPLPTTNRTCFQRQLHHCLVAHLLPKFATQFFYKPKSIMAFSIT